MVSLTDGLNTMPPCRIMVDGELKSNPEYKRRYREKNLEIMKEKSREYYQKNKEKIKKKQLKYYNENKEIICKKNSIKNKERWINDLDFIKKQKERKRMYTEQRRLETISYYSNNTMKCVCCNEDEISFLTIDHINNNGNEHRRKIKRNGGWNFYNWLKKNNYPEGYQVLCMNCQWGKRMNNGVCPHKNEVNNND